MRALRKVQHVWAVLAGAVYQMSSLLLRYRKILWATTRVEMKKRYAGSAFGMVWVFLYPALLLSVYLFVYTVIFGMRFPGFSQLDYVIYVFCGLIPYLGFVEAVTASCVAVKQNIHLIKNVMLPIELIPMRVVVVSIVTQLVSMVILLILIMLNGSVSPYIVGLPLVLGLQVLALWGLAWMLSALGVLLLDVSYFANLFVLLLMFVSPIGFKPEMIPDSFSFMVYLNPIYYMTEMFRATMLYGNWPTVKVFTIYAVLCLGTFVLGSVFFLRFKDYLTDYE